MGAQSTALILMLALAGASAVIVKNQWELKEAKKWAPVITLSNFWVPPGESIDLWNLRPGTVVEFAGITRFGYSKWKGPLIQVTGRNIKIVGLRGHMIDAEGHRWWDNWGGNGGIDKPRMFHVAAVDLTIQGLFIKNMPCLGFALNGQNIYVRNVRIDNKDGHNKGGHNTDGFDVANAKHIVIENSIVENQDDCLAVNSGTDVSFVHNVCIGGHGISIAPMGNGVMVTNVRMANNLVATSMCGLRIKTTKFERGLVKGISFENTILKDIEWMGIGIQGNYLNYPGPEGEPTWGFPITDVRMLNIRGNMKGKWATGVYIWVKESARWIWSVNIRGGNKWLKCQGIPAGLRIPCGI